MSKRDNKDHIRGLVSHTVDGPNPPEKHQDYVKYWPKPIQKKTNKNNLGHYSAYIRASGRHATAAYLGKCSYSVGSSRLGLWMCLQSPKAGFHAKVRKENVIFAFRPLLV